MTTRGVEMGKARAGAGEKVGGIELCMYIIIWCLSRTGARLYVYITSYGIAIFRFPF